jgi:catechol 2,3-dioxygenase-like lactoylglutathione lyase family enzyme
MKAKNALDYEGAFYSIYVIIHANLMRRITMSTRFDMIGIFVIDLQKMVAFYRDVLGIAIDWEGKGPYAEFKHEGIRLSMYERKELPKLLGQNPDYPTKLNGTFELALNVGVRENVDIKFREIISKGGTEIYSPRDEPWKMRSAMIADPEGNMIEIASDFWA